MNGRKGLERHEVARVGLWRQRGCFKKGKKGTKKGRDAMKRQAKAMNRREESERDEEASGESKDV